MAGDNLDISSGSEPSDSEGGGRKFLGVQFACCDVYTRIYVNRTRTAYEGFCPKCGRPVRIRIGSGGTDCRFFTVY